MKNVETSFSCKQLPPIESGSGDLCASLGIHLSASWEGPGPDQGASAFLGPRF